MQGVYCSVGGRQQISADHTSGDIPLMQSLYVLWWYFITSLQSPYEGQNWAVVGDKLGGVVGTAAGGAALHRDLTGWRNGLTGTAGIPKRRAAKSCTWGGTTPCTWGHSAFQKRIVRFWWQPSGTQATSVFPRCQEGQRWPWAASGSAASK